LGKEHGGRKLQGKRKPSVKEKGKMEVSISFPYHGINKKEDQTKVQTHD